ncbi:MAG TPA: efflux RND transporter periplasmic adaptor subunit [Candidatus Sulfopaludibacter sp.]|nr:efflux RND transporter periplasmic adaptor subunit [Candidatus Sulfopaludibacter sp.]
MKRKTIAVLLTLAAVAGVLLYSFTEAPHKIILTGIVTTDEVIVSSEIQGRLRQLLVKEGDTVTNGELLAQIQPLEQEAELDFYRSSEHQSTADLAQAQADLENARLNFERIGGLYSNKVESVQTYDQARTVYDAARAKVQSLDSQIQAARAQAERARVRLGYTEIRAPIDGLVDTRAALQGEVVNPGQAIVTLINPDDLWVRADVEETYIDRIHLGDRLPVQLPSGAVRAGTVFYRGVDADYATQRDVSRTKRDIRTFEIRLRCDNSDRSLAVGMTAYVTLPLK